MLGGYWVWEDFALYRSLGWKEDRLGKMSMLALILGWGGILVTVEVAGL